MVNLVIRGEAGSDNNSGRAILFNVIRDNTPLLLSTAITSAWYSPAVFIDVYGAECIECRRTLGSAEDGLSWVRRIAW
jgi:hypothetical protein